MLKTMNVFYNIVKHINVFGAQWHMTFLTKVECHIRMLYIWATFLLVYEKVKVFCPRLFSTVCKKTYLIAVAHTTSHLSQNLSYIHNEITKNVLLI